VQTVEGGVLFLNLGLEKFEVGLSKMGRTCEDLRLADSSDFSI
jgi:hypothetical protein